MSRTRLITVCLFAAVMASSPAVSIAQEDETVDLSFETVELPDELARVLRDYERAWRTDDEESIAELFTVDGYAMPSGRRPVYGREAIRDAYARTGGPLNLRAIDYAMSDSTAHIVGVYTYNLDAGFGGKYLLILEKSPSGRWMIAADMDNSNR